MEEWIEDSPPSDAPGWYAALRCFDPLEGFFPIAAYWDGEAWSEPAVSHHIGLVQRDATAAKALAEENDPEW